MTIFNKILVAYDGSPHSKKAIEKAAEFLAVESRIEAHIVNVIQPPHVEVHRVYGVNLSQDLYQEMLEVSQKTIEEARELLAEYEDACHFKQLNGKAYQEILNYAEENEIDLIILGSRGLGAIKGMLLGSVSQNVVQHASCDVLVVK